MEAFDIAVIGGCASGLCAAVQAARLHPGKRVAVFERLPRVGKKILATGNGRCNLSNRSALTHNYTNSAFASPALHRHDVVDTLDFFARLGLLTFTDSEGRIYPLSNAASGVLDALRFAVDGLGITVICDHPVKEIKRSKGRFVIDSDFSAAAVILAAGGKASPSQGSDGSGYALAKQLGHTVTDLSPALVPLNADTAFTKPLKGIRIHKAALTLCSAGKKLAHSEGEILFTEYGLSGIAAMELASEVEKARRNVKSDCFTLIDFVPDMNFEELTYYLKLLISSTVSRDFDNLLSGLLPKAAGIAVCKAVKLYSPSRKIDTLTQKELYSLASALKKTELKVTSSRGFDTAQVTCGGVNVNEIDPRTLESRLCPGLFFAGEIIDVDGGCGGFNLQWAWSSGLTAGELGGKKL